ncbi:cupin domain-containing protein [Kitasatospora sp. NBC_00458]|uniref:cupin domain-containing protein n=1 Tax=Kitasatospora sp. NBC_00458 TaxID=2903568 RepID=UPI002E173384
MILVPAAVPRTAPAFRRLIDPNHLPSARGGLTVETLPPGVRVEQHPSRVAELVTVVLSGRIRAAGRVLGPGEGLYHPPGSSCGLTALPGAPAAVLTVRPVSDVGGGPAPLPYAVPLGPPRPGTRTASATRTVPAARRSGDEDPHPYGPGSGSGPGPRPGSGRPVAAGRIAGSAGMEVRWLATADTVGARRLTVAASAFAAGGRHDLHRHPHADEFFLVLSGGGGHLTGNAEVPLRAGDLVYVPAGEWHGFRPGPAAPTTALYGYLGASSLAGAGYQLRPSDVPEVA